MLTAYADTKRLLKFAELHLTKYLVKPVEPEEFVETIEKIAQNLWKFTSEVALGKNYVWHKEVQALYRNGVEVVLTSTERHIFALLAEHFGSCVTYEEFVYTLWDEDADYEKSLQTLKHHIANIRKKLPELSIRNSYAEGYVLSSV
jgi:DNA-binding response OmpR family regulator